MFWLLNINALITSTRTHPSGLVPSDLSASCGAARALNSWHMVLSLPCPLLLRTFAQVIPTVWNSPSLSTPSARVSVQYLLLVIYSCVVHHQQTQPLNTKILSSPTFFWLRIWEQLNQVDSAPGLRRGYIQAASQASGVWSKKIPLQAPSHGEG